MIPPVRTPSFFFFFLGLLFVWRFATRAKPIVSGHWREDRPTPRLEGRALQSGRRGGERAALRVLHAGSGNSGSPPKEKAGAHVFFPELPAVLRSNGHRAFEPWRSARMCG